MIQSPVHLLLPLRVRFADNEEVGVWRQQCAARLDNDDPGPTRAT